MPKPFEPEPGVQDPVFSVLLGITLENHEGRFDSTLIRREVEKIGRKPKLPYRWMESITRVPDRERPGDPPEEKITSLFDRAVDLPVPYQILGYHPGSFQGTQELDFREIPMGRVDVSYHTEEKKKIVSHDFAIENVRLFILTGGQLQIDIDGWLDRLLGSKLDDTRVAALVIFRKDGQLYGMALGYNRSGDPRSGTIDFLLDKVLYPNPSDLKAVARHMRRVLESKAPDTAARYSNW